MTDRVCPATGCTSVTAPGKFMCRPHWFGLPVALRDEVWRTWRDVLAGRRADKSAVQKLEDVRAYRAACAAATRYWQGEAAQ